MGQGFSVLVSTKFVKWDNLWPAFLLDNGKSHKMTDKGTIRYRQTLIRLWPNTVLKHLI